MATYVYKCINEVCTHNKEQSLYTVKQSMKDDALTECPLCTMSISRVIQHIPLQFKGSGWFTNGGQY
jgi:putative FmdB family regulatory protein